MEVKLIVMSTYKHYEPDFFDDAPLTPERMLWLSLSELREGQNKLRKSLFREVGELKKENSSLRQTINDLKQNMGQEDLFSDLFAVAK